MSLTISRFLNPFRSVESGWNRLNRAGYARRLRSMMGKPRWCVDQVEWGGGELVVRGWAFPPAGRHSRLDFLVNDQSFEQVQYPILRKDLTQTFWFLPNAANSGFTCRIPIQRLRTNRSDDLHLRLVDRDGSKRSTAYGEYYFPGEAAVSTPLPDSIRMQRVHGPGHASTFQYVGYSAFVNMENA